LGIDKSTGIKQIERVQFDSHCLSECWFIVIIIYIVVILFLHELVQRLGRVGGEISSSSSGDLGPRFMWNGRRATNGLGSGISASNTPHRRRDERRRVAKFAPGEDNVVIGLGPPYVEDGVD